MKVRYTYRSLQSPSGERAEQSVWSVTPGTADPERLLALEAKIRAVEAALLLGPRDEAGALPFVRRAYPAAQRVRFDVAALEPSLASDGRALYVDVTASAFATDERGEAPVPEFDYHATQLAMSALERKVG